jgi:hypothetical protein
MGFAASARRLAFGAAATVAAAMPFSHADAQSRAVPANSSRPATSATITRMVSSPVRNEVDAMQAAADYSKDGKAIGIIIALNEAVRAKGVTPQQVGQPIVDELATRGIKSKYFYRDITPGTSSGILIIISGSLYVNSQGKNSFTPVTIRQEYGSILADYTASQRRVIASQQNEPSLNKD